MVCIEFLSDYINNNPNIKCQTNKNVSKYLDTLPIDKAETKTKQQLKWDIIMRDYDLEIDWEKAYSISYKSSTDITLRNCQYKILNRILPTNKDLLVCKLSNCSLCDFCYSTIDTLEHLLFKCETVQQLWIPLYRHLESKGVSIHFSIMDVCFGTDKCQNNNIAINFIILIMKQYIYNAKLKQNTPRFEFFKLPETKIKHRNTNRSDKEHIYSF